MIRRWFGPTTAAADVIVSVSSHVGAPANTAVKSVFCTSGGETGVVPSAWNTRAVIALGGALLVPPVPPFGSRSRTDRFHAGPVPASCTSSVNVPGVPGLIDAGPPFVSVTVSGPTIVIGGELPG